MVDPAIAYLLHVVPGLERITAREIGLSVPKASDVRGLSGFDERTSLLALSYRGDPGHLLALRTVEDVFVLAVDQTEISGGYAGLRVAREAVEQCDALDAAIALGLQIHGRRARRPTFRVIARAAGEHAFRRVDLRQAIERAIEKRVPALRLVADDAHLEFWVHLVRDHLVIGIRLSSADLRYRTYKQANVPASLKPTIAAAMVLVSQPRPDDVVLDPMCGAGTLLIERGEASRYRRLLGGDGDPEAVTATRANIGPRYQPIELRQWNAQSLPVADRSVDAILCNLPFGRQIGSEQGNRVLYPAVIAEWSRVLAPGGRLVLLTADSRLLTTVIAKHRGLRLQDRLPLRVRGLPAAIHLIRPTSSGT
ncbi:MAG: methyltransferase domain-containing protein [Dehalococcoidia bacterium]